jgi:hypothetical protein
VLLFAHLGIEVNGGAARASARACTAIRFVQKVRVTQSN